jgi:hypothetical protein
MADDLTLPAVVPIKRAYPHVDQITDFNAQQSTKLLWDRVHDLEERLQASEAANQVLVDAHNTTQTQITAVQTLANGAIAIAQQPGLTTIIPGGGGPAAPPQGPPPGDPGSQSNPIIAMSIDPTAIATSVRLSRQSYGFGPNPADDQYWITKATNAEQFSNGKWYQGWNAYWHARADPANPGSADPNLGDLPSPAG